MAANIISVPGAEIAGSAANYASFAEIAGSSVTASVTGVVSFEAVPVSVVSEEQPAAVCARRRSKSAAEQVCRVCFFHEYCILSI